MLARLTGLYCVRVERLLIVESPRGRAPRRRSYRMLALTGLAMVLAHSRAILAQRPPLTPFSARKAESLLRTQLPCLGCHTLRGEGGAIGPDLTTVRERQSAAYIAAMVEDPQVVVPGSAMPKTAMTPALRDLIVAYLSALPARTPAPADAAVPSPNAVASPVGGEALYQRWCVSCHGAKGAGDGPNAKHLPVAPAAHASREAMERRSDDALYDTISGGGAIMNRSPRMPAFGATLSDAQIRDLVSYIRTLCRCQGPAWSREAPEVKP